MPSVTFRLSHAQHAAAAAEAHGLRLSLEEYCAQAVEVLTAGRRLAAMPVLAGPGVRQTAPRVPGWQPEARPAQEAPEAEVPSLAPLDLPSADDLTAIEDVA